MYAFIHVEKTGGTTLLAILRRSFGSRHCDIRVPMNRRPATYRDVRPCIEAEDVRRVQRVYRNLRGISGHNVKPYADLGDKLPFMRFFTFLRNPRGMPPSSAVIAVHCLSVNSLSINSFSLVSRPSRLFA